METHDLALLSEGERAFLQALNDLGVRYLLVGMSAALLQGARGATEDIDLWFEQLGDPLRYWRAGGSKTLAELRRRLDSVTFAAMETWIMSHPLSADTAAALRSERVGVPAALAENALRLAQPGAAPSPTNLADIQPAVS